MKPESLSPLGPKGARLLAFLVGGIAAGRIQRGMPETFPVYSDALRAMGVRAGGDAGRQLLNEALQELHTWTLQSAALPKIAGLVVNDESGRPNEQFTSSDNPNWSLGEANRAIDFDWRPYLPEFGDDSIRVREDEDAMAGYDGVVTVEPPPAQIRQTGITVAQVLQWLAAGLTETEILRRESSLNRRDILASLAYAAERESESARGANGNSRLSEIVRAWDHKLTLPKADPADPRRDYLLRKYWRAGA